LPVAPTTAISGESVEGVTLVFKMFSLVEVDTTREHKPAYYYFRGGS
jgi:hypothetical protein